MKGAVHDPTIRIHSLGLLCYYGDFDCAGGEHMKHYGDVSKINGGEIEPFPIAVTKMRFKEVSI